MSIYTFIIINGYFLEKNTRRFHYFYVTMRSRPSYHFYKQRFNQIFLFSVKCVVKLIDKQITYRMCCCCFFLRNEKNMYMNYSRRLKFVINAIKHLYCLFFFLLFQNIYVVISPIICASYADFFTDRLHFIPLQIFFLFICKTNCCDFI